MFIFKMQVCSNVIEMLWDNVEHKANFVFARGLSRLQEARGECGKPHPAEEPSSVGKQNARARAHEHLPTSSAPHVC